MDLNDDVVTEVLVHLPVKSLLRFKSVCKSWCSIIDSSAFRKSHLKNQSKNNNDDDDDILFLQFSIGKNKRITWELSSTLSVQNNYWKLMGKAFPPHFHEFLNVNSWISLIVCEPINGLICMYDDYPIKNDRVRLSIAICNPCLGESKILPLSPVLLDSLIGCSEEWSKRPFKYRTVGFGFDSVTKDYKVVQVIRSLNGRAYVEVYSGRTNTWRVVDNTDIFDGRRSSLVRIQQIKTWYKSSGAAAYWQMSGDDPDDVILSFDMQKEVFGTIRLPEFEESLYSKVFVMDDDSLVMFAYSADYRRLEAWELEIAGKKRGSKKRGWTRARNVNALQSEGMRAPQLLALWKNGVVLSTDRDMANLIFYDYRTDEIRKCFEFHMSLRFWQIFLQYKITLNSLEMCLN